MTNDKNKDIIFIISGIILGIVFAYLIGELLVQFVKFYINGSQAFGFTQNQGQSSETEMQLRVTTVSEALEMGIDIFSPRFLESARDSQREIMRTFVEEVRLEREKEGLRKLGLLPIKEFNSQENLSPCNECAICLDDFQEGDICRVLVNCSHMFHSKCVDDWLTNNQRCPICRSEI